MAENTHINVPRSILIDIEKIEDLWVDDNGHPLSIEEKRARNIRRIVRRPPTLRNIRPAPIDRMNNPTQPTASIQSTQHTNVNSHLPIISPLTRNRMLVNELLTPTENPIEQMDIPAPVFTIDPKLIPSVIFNLPPTGTNTINQQLIPNVLPNFAMNNVISHSVGNYLPITPIPTINTLPSGQEVRNGVNGPTIANTFSLASNEELLRQANLNNFIS
jgi:hypothetical protein